jgi:hypothetical protein
LSEFFDSHGFSQVFTSRVNIPTVEKGLGKRQARVFGFPRDGLFSLNHPIVEGLTVSCTPILHHPALLAGPAAMAEVLLKMEAAPAGPVSDRGVQKRKATLGGSSLDPSQAPR